MAWGRYGHGGGGPDMQSILPIYKPIYKPIYTPIDTPIDTPIYKPVDTPINTPIVICRILPVLLILI